MTDTTIVLGAVATLTSAVSALFGLLYSRISKDLADARLELATERKARLDFVLEKLRETEAREKEQESIVSDVKDLIQSQTRGGLGNAGGRGSSGGGGGSGGSGGSGGAGGFRR